MNELPAWLLFLVVVIACLWLLSLVFFLWVAITSPARRTRVQYLLIRAHFFKGFELDRLDEPMMEVQRNQYLATIRIFRLVVSAIAFVNLMTALVLMLLGMWLLSMEAGVGVLMQVLIMVVAPLLLLLTAYSLVLFILLHRSYGHLMRMDLESGRHAA